MHFDLQPARGLITSVLSELADTLQFLLTIWRLSEFLWLLSLILLLGWKSLGKPSLKPLTTSVDGAAETFLLLCFTLRPLCDFPDLCSGGILHLARQVQVSINTRCQWDKKSCAINRERL